jgi:hypothetical protein
MTRKQAKRGARWLNNSVEQIGNKSANAEPTNRLIVRVCKSAK